MANFDALLQSLTNSPQGGAVVPAAAPPAVTTSPGPAPTSSAPGALPTPPAAASGSAPPQSMSFSDFQKLGQKASPNGASGAAAASPPAAASGNAPPGTMSFQDFKALGGNQKEGAPAAPPPGPRATVPGQAGSYGAGDQFVHGMTFGLDEPVKAAGQAAADWAAGAGILPGVTGAPKQSFGDAFMQDRADIAKQREAYVAAHPVAGAVSTLAGGVLGGAGAPGAAVESVSSAVGRIAKGALVGAGFGGVAGAADSDFTPGGLVRGAATGAAVGGALGGVLGGVAEVAPRVWDAIVGPAGLDAQKTAAAAKITGAADTSAPDLAAKLAAPGTGVVRDPVTGQSTYDPNAALVPGSKPTTFQATNDPGLGQLERGVAAQNPAEFNARRADQNTARTAAIEGVAPPGATSSAVGDSFRQHLADMDAANAASVSAAQQKVSTAVDAMGGAQTKDELGRIIRPELQDAKTAAKQNESNLWQSIDPNGNLAVSAAPIRDTANTVANSVGRLQQPMAGEEQAIFGQARMLPTSMPFSDLGDLRSRLLGAIRDERFNNGETPALRRMTQLRQSIDDTMGNAATGTDTQALLNSQKISLMSERNNLQQQLSGLGGGNPDVVRAYPQLQSQQQAIQSRLGQIETQLTSAGQATPFDAAANARYRAAADATRERKQTFNTGPVGEALQAGPNGLPYKAADSEVAAKFFNGGSSAREDTAAYLNAVGNRPAAVNALQDYAAASLKASALEKDGTLNLPKYQAWSQRHGDAMRAFPELAGKFQTAADAQAALTNTLQQGGAAREAFQKSSARYFLQGDPVKAFGTALNSKNPGATMAELNGLVAHDPDAHWGLQRAGVDYIKQQYMSPAAGDPGSQALHSAAFQKFIRDRGADLGQVFSQQQVLAMQHVAQDLQRANLSVASKLLGGSNTAQDINEILKGHGGIPGAAEGHGTQNMIGTVFIAEMAERLPLLEHIPGVAPLIMIGRMIQGHIKPANMAKVDRLVTQAMLHPEIAHTLLTHITSPGNAAMFTKRLSGQIGALGYAGAEDQGRSGEAPRSGSGSDPGWLPFSAPAVGSLPPVGGTVDKPDYNFTRNSDIGPMSRTVPLSATGLLGR